jgi:hypothetical protein
LPHSGFVQQTQARGIGHVVTFFACRKKVANTPNPINTALWVLMRMGKKLPPNQLELYKRIDEILYYK